jgi:hypothetical protein
VDADSRTLVKELKDAGLSDEAITAAWPSWWKDEAATSASARAELRFTLSRNLGLAPQSLLGQRVEFVWQDAARFKNLTGTDSFARGALASFGVAVARILLRAVVAPDRGTIEGLKANGLRSAILSSHHLVDLPSLLAACWGMGIPVIHLRIFPLPAKSMRAMVVESDGRYAILLGRDASYPAPIAFTLAHEIGHAALGHIGPGRAVIDVGEPTASEADLEEREADSFALELLTGSRRPVITTSIDNFSGRALAQACMEAGPREGIEPGTLALCVGYLRNDWIAANAALHFIYSQRAPVWRPINRLAEQQLQWDALGQESARYLHSILALNV